jgi:hypothetical protein
MRVTIGSVRAGQEKQYALTTGPRGVRHYVWTVCGASYTLYKALKGTVIDRLLAPNDPQCAWHAYYNRP